MYKRAFRAGFLLLARGHSAEAQVHMGAKDTARTAMIVSGMLKRSHVLYVAEYMYPLDLCRTTQKLAYLWVGMFQTENVFQK